MREMENKKRKNELMEGRENEKGRRDERKRKEVNEGKKKGKTIK